MNSLGFVRINIPNPHGVYMHDTPAKGIFGDDFRFVSSGCVRVQNVRDYITWLLKDTPGWDARPYRRGDPRPASASTRASPRRCRSTGSMSPPGRRDGLVQFRDDIYQRDGFGASGAVASAAAPAAGAQARNSGILEPMSLTDMPVR